MKKSLVIGALFSLLFLSTVFYCSKSSGSVAQGNAANAGVQQVNNLTKATVEISAETGGYINVGNTQLVIPQGAIASDATITAELVDIPETFAGAQKLGKGIKFSPEGLQFLTPAELSVCYEASQAAGLNENSAMIYYKDHSNNLVGIAGSVNKATRCVKSHIEHFSSYIAIAQAQVAGNTAPTIAGANFLPTTPLAGIPLRVRTQINDVNGGAVTGQVVSAFLYYRTVGAPTYIKVPLTPDTTDDTVTNRYAFLIPAAEVTLAGIQYYFEATDNLNVTTTTTPVTRTVPTAANGIRFDVAALNIGAGFTRALTLQASDAAPGGTWQNISIENQNLSNGTLGTLQRTTPSAIRLTTSGAGAGVISSTAGAFTATSNVTVIAGLLSHIVITDLNQVALTGTYLIGINQTVELDAVGYDSFGNISTIKPNFTTTGGIGSVLIDLTGAHFTAGASATTGVLTANIAGLTDTLDFLVYVPPAVAATAPVDGATNVNYIGSNIAMTFTKSMDTATLTTNTTGACSGSIQVSATNFADCVPMTSATPQFFSGNALAILTPAIPLLGNTTYKVRVLATARDTFNYPMAGTYTSVSGFLTIPDVTAPVSGTALVFSNVRNRGITLRWGAGSDDSTPVASLQYKVVKDDNSLANISTVALADAKTAADLIQDWTSNLTSKVVTGLSATKTYHWAILARDLAGNKILYTPATQATTTWEIAGSMLTPRWYHTATALNDGRAFIAGGRYDFGAADLASTEIYDPISNSFSYGPNMTAGRHSHTATLLGNGKILLVGGITSNTTNTTSELCDSVTNSCGLISNLVMPRTGHTATLLADGRVLIVGGHGLVMAAEIYDPATNTFSLSGNINISRYHHTATLLPGGKVLITGGWNFSAWQPLSSTEIFDPTTNTFSTGPNMAGTRYLHTADLLNNGKVFIAGSNSGGSELYDPSLNTISLTTGNGIYRFGATSAILQSGRVLMISGTSLAGLTTITELFDPITDTFSNTANMNLARNMHTSVVLSNGQVLVAGGSNGSATMTSAELFE